MISANNLIFERYYQPVFEPVSFELAAGELLLVTGPNGAGKTTLIRLLAGLLRPDQGSITMTGGLEPSDCAYLGHQLAVKSDLSVAENLAFAHKMCGSPGHDPNQAATSLGLGSLLERQARTLSAGQKKRCALAQLLLTDARLWLLDEPYTNLDSEGADKVDQLLRQHLAAGGACVMSTHGGLQPAGVTIKHCRLVPFGIAA